MMTEADREKRRQENKDLKHRLKFGEKPDYNKMTGLLTYASGEKYRAFKSGFVKIPTTKN